MHRGQRLEYLIVATYLLDTGLVLRHLRGQRRTVQLLRSLGKESRLAIASVTRLEVHAGMQPEERYATQKLLARLATLDMDRETADRAGDLIAASKRVGQSLSVPRRHYRRHCHRPSPGFSHAQPGGFSTHCGLKFA